MTIARTRPHRFVFALLVALSFVGLGAGAQAAPLNVVTPGEQNTQSGENGCAKAPCGAGHWLHYPELIGVALGAGYSVHNDGDGGAVLGCDAATATAAGTNSFCKSAPYTSSINPKPDIVIIGPFGEHDQRIVTMSTANQTTLYMQSVFEGAYEGMVQKYLAFTNKIFIMTPIDVPWGGTTNLPAGKDIVKDLMLPAAKKVAQAHGLTVIDTYTAISGTQQLVNMYYATDGQVNAAGQQKMADLIVAALKDAAGGADGGATDAGDAAVATDGAADASGSGGAAGTGGAIGTGGVAGTGGASGSGGTSGATGGASGTGGSASAGTGGNSGVGNGGSSSSGTSSSGGCAVASSGVPANAWETLIVFALGGLAFGRRRPRDRRHN